MQFQSYIGSNVILLLEIRIPINTNSYAASIIILFTDY
jgi:hypothetical protein